MAEKVCKFIKAIAWFHVPSFMNHHHRQHPPPGFIFFGGYFAQQMKQAYIMGF